MIIGARGWGGSCDDIACCVPSVQISAHQYFDPTYALSGYQQGVIHLTNHEHEYRLRVGSYRVLFNWDGTIKVVEIEEVRKRDERTY
jgi:hypothetical protein